jgi:hypothetical protein
METQKFVMYIELRVTFNDVKTLLMSSCKVRDIFGPVLTEFEVYRQIFSFKPTVSNFMEIRSVRAALLYADGQTDTIRS